MGVFDQKDEQAGFFIKSWAWVVKEWVVGKMAFGFGLVLVIFRFWYYRTPRTNCVVC